MCTGNEHIIELAYVLEGKEVGLVIALSFNCCIVRNQKNGLNLKKKKQI